MPNWCSNIVQYNNANIEGIIKLFLRKTAENPYGFFLKDKNDAEAIFDLEFNNSDLETSGSFNFETKWGISNSTVIQLIKILKCSWLELEYEEQGNALAGIFEYYDNELSHTIVTDKYWTDIQKQYDFDFNFDEEPPDIADYLDSSTKEIISLKI